MVEGSFKVAVNDLTAALLKETFDSHLTLFVKSGFSVSGSGGLSLILLKDFYINPSQTVSSWFVF